MAKDPAFLFYSQDFFTGTATLSFEEKGKYIHILCLMHQQGRLNEETIRFLVGSVSVNLKSKFSIDENGFWYNNRLESEIEKRNKFTKSRHENGSKGGRPPKNKKPLGLATDNHMGNVNENVLLDTNKHNKLFNTMPVFSDFNGLPDNYRENAYEIVFRTKRIKLDDEDIIAMWEVFKKTKLNGHEYYHNEGKVYNHFVDWIKKQDFKDVAKNVSKESVEDKVKNFQQHVIRD